MSSATRDQIREAALHVFARKGYANTLVEDVAGEAGVSKGTIYTYFDRKEELLGAVYHGLREELRGREEDVLSSDRPPLDKIRLMLRSFVDVVGSREALAQVILDIWIAGMRDPDRFGIDFSDVYASYRALLKELLSAAQVRGEMKTDLPSLTPAVVMGAVDGVFLQWLLDPDAVNFPDAADDILEVLYRGLRSREAS